MKLAVLSMIRDEADILPAFLEHASELFDIGFLLDHRSSDGSQQIMKNFCSGFPEWRYFKLDFAGRHQREMSNIFMRRAFEAGADAVVFLDADEFIDRTKEELVFEICRLIKEQEIGLLRWIPCVPKTFSKGKFDLDEPLYVAPHPSPASLVGPKVVITRQIFLHTNGALKVTQGNHAVEGEQGPFRTSKIGSIYHVPIRSKRQFFRKAVLGAVSHLARGNLMSVQGFHKKNMVEMIGAGKVTADRLRGMAAHYTEPVGEAEPISLIDLEAAGYQLRTLNVARSHKDIRRLSAVGDYIVIANSLRDAQIEIPDETTFTFDGNIVRLNTHSAPFADVPEIRAALERTRTELGIVAAQKDRVESDRQCLESDFVALTVDWQRREADLVAVTADRQRLEADLVAATADRQRLEADLVAVTADRRHLEADLGAVTADRRHLQADLVAVAADRQRLQAELEALTVESARAQAELENMRAEVHRLRASRSWRITAPLRALRHAASRSASRLGLTRVFAFVPPRRGPRA